MVQYGFFYDQSRCEQCRTCTAACKSWNGLPPGRVKWDRIMEWETGSWPKNRLNLLFAPCYHCEDPVCVDAANGAMFKEDKYGAVLIDPDQATSPSLKAAWEACPYGAIAFDSDAGDAKASMCTMCIDRLEQGLKPVCVMSCPHRALDFGPLADLQTRYGTNRDLEGIPSSKTTQPSIIFKPHTPHSELVPYDANKALNALQKRIGAGGKQLPNVFTDPSIVTADPGSLGIKRTFPNFHPRTTQEFMTATTSDEG